MIAEFGLALGVSLIGMVVVGTIVKGVLGLRSAVNWLVQTAVLAAAATVLSLPTGPTVLMLAFPTVIHTAKWFADRFVGWKAARGDYGEEVRWAHELIEQEQDNEFTHAQNVLPKSEVMEISIIADSKDEMRDLMVERYNELVSEELSEHGDKFKL